MRKLLLLLMITIVTVSASAQTFLAHNVWFEKPQAMYACNYKRGTMIPAGIDVDHVELRTDRRNRTILYFEVPEYDKGFQVYIQERLQGSDFTFDQLKEQMFTTKSFEEMVKGLPQNFIDAIEKGEIVQGMPKEVVLISWGYPPHGTTFTTNLNTWVYPMNRWKTREVIFDKNGLTISGSNTD